VRIGRVDTAQLTRTWREAFSDYLVDMSAMTDERIRVRAAKNGVDLAVSPGAFAGQRMVGFTLVGVDTFKGERAAFDAATGIVPAARGGGLAGRMLAWAEPRLRALGVARFYLEVIRENEPALRAYRKAGFAVTRELRCFRLPLAPLRPGTDGAAVLPLRAVDRAVVAPFAAETDWVPSWENSFAAIARIDDRLLALGAFDGETCVAELVYSPHLGWVMSLVVARPWRRRGLATALLRELARRLPEEDGSVKVLNVDAGDRATLRLLETAGAVGYVDQFEMARAL